MVPLSSAEVIWAVRIPGAELRCVTWQVAGQQRVGILDEYEMYAQTTAADVDAARRWAWVARREIDRLGLGTCPAFDPLIDVTIDPFEPYDTFDDVVADGSSRTDSHDWRH